MIQLIGMTTPLLNRLLLASLIWVTASFLIHELSSLDVWWHLVIGEDILRNLQVPSINIYSAGALNQPYHDSHWLFQAVLAISHRLAGLNGPILFMVFIWAITLSVLYRELRTYSGVITAVFITFLAMGASAERFLPRPEIITFLMIVLFYTRLRQEKYQTFWQVALLLLLQIIWVNCHGLFVIGPFMIGCYWLLHSIHYARGQTNHFHQLTVLLVLVGASLLASPYGTGALEYSYLLFHEVGQTAPAHMQAVNELSPTFGVATMGASAFWFFMALLILTLVSTASNFKKVPVERLLIIAVLCLAALTGRRNIVLFALVAAPFIGENLSWYLARFTPSTVISNGAKGALAAAMLLWSSYPLSGNYYLDMEIPARTRLGVTPDFFPHGLAAYIRQHDIQGQVYNTNRLGGFYLYQLYPDRIPFIDGRWEIYGDRFFQLKSQALQNYTKWQRWSAENNISSALLHHTSDESGMLAPALYQDPDWSLVYYDFAASFFVKNDFRGSAQPIIFSATSQIPVGDVRPDSRFMLSVFYRNMGLKQLLLINLEQLLPFGYHEQAILLEMGQISIDLARYNEAIKYYRLLLKSDNRHIAALADLSFIFYQRRQYQEALAYSERLMSADSSNIDSQFNHALVLMALGRKQDAITLLNKILIAQPGYQKAKLLLKNNDSR
ncbi:hypothetical protein MNBD_GAMMA26-1506 [hydrothermal vent metagenome]|uniref:Uncharacterized protein n=1 Tax=hydrothermal vent metagenome TaxID=652676 RepID=A0A3B1B2I8_9ZZZZ